MEGARKMVMKLRGDLLGYCETGPGCCSLLFSVSWWHRLVRLGDRCIESQQAAFLGTNLLSDMPKLVSLHRQGKVNAIAVIFYYDIFIRC